VVGSQIKVTHLLYILTNPSTSISTFHLQLLLPAVIACKELYESLKMLILWFIWALPTPKLVLLP